MVQTCDRYVLDKRETDCCYFTWKLWKTCQHTFRSSNVTVWHLSFERLSWHSEIRDGKGWFLADEDLKWLMVSSLISFMAVGSDSWSPINCSLTDEGFEWGWLEYYSLFLPPASFLYRFVPLCFELTTGFSHGWMPTVWVWGLLLPWLMVDSCLCKLSLLLVFERFLGAQ